VSPDMPRLTKTSTANEYISLPCVDLTTGGLPAIGFFHAGLRGCIELAGSESCPLLAPVLDIGGTNLFDGPTTAEILSHWIPRVFVEYGCLRADYTVFAPLNRRGFVCVLSIENTGQSDIEVRAGVKGCWESTRLVAGLKKPIVGRKRALLSSWKLSAPVIEFQATAPLFAVAAVTPEVVRVNIDSSTSPDAAGTSGTDYDRLYFEFVDNYMLEPGKRKVLPVYVGLGLEEVSAVASGHELWLQGWERMLAALHGWLDEHTIRHSDEQLTRLINRNSFYSFFYSQATTLDSEELVAVCARDSRNDSCGIYRDRDAMRWSLPAVLQIDWSQARKLIIYGLTAQFHNVGVRSRFINGVVMEPGMQLDQLCAPIRALKLYVQLTGDMSILFDRRVQNGVNTIQQILGAQRSPEAALFETLLLPSGEPATYPYVCFSNVLVWRVLLDISWLYDKIRDMDRAEEATALADRVKDAVLRVFIVPGPRGEQFARSVDLRGNYELGDDPSGSLRLLTYFDFCHRDDPAYRNTVAWIQEHEDPYKGCGKLSGSASGLQGNVTSIFNIISDLLAGRKEEAIEFLRRAELEDGIACELIRCSDGRCADGPALASCAGYLAFALRLATKAELPETAIAIPKRRQDDTLYHPPPEVSQDTKKARL